MEKLFHNLSKTCDSGVSAYSKEYLNAIKNIFSTVSNPNLLKSHIKTNNFSDSESLLRFSLVFNDLSLLTMNGSNKLNIIMLQQQWFKDNFESNNTTITVSTNLLNDLGINLTQTQILPGLIFPDGNSVDNILKELSPFIERGKLLIQPDRSLFYLKDELTEEGNKQWHGLNVNQFSALNDWEILEEQESRPIPISYGNTDHLNQKSMFEITIPYLEGISFKELAKILDDEGDLVSGVRQSIKQAIEECGSDDVDPRIIIKDIIDPKVDALNRKFKSTVNSRAFRIAGAGVGTVVLAYTAASTMGLPSAAATLFGSGGLGLLGREYSDYKDHINTIKDDPYYFFWRCKNIQKKF